MTDERQGDGLWPAIERLPFGAGLVFRHYAVPPAERRALWLEVRRRGLAKDLLLIAAGAPLPGANGVHNRTGRGVRTASVHDLAELKAAERAGADLVFLSPVYPTFSHPGAPALGPRRFALIAHQARVPVVALGGMDFERARTLGGAHGWAAIDAWSAA
jgi:thiamine-phosphate pyrophosphorylase